MEFLGIRVDETRRWKVVTRDVGACHICRRFGIMRNSRLKGYIQAHIIAGIARRF